MPPGYGLGVTDDMQFNWAVTQLPAENTDFEGYLIIAGEDTFGLGQFPSPKYKHTPPLHFHRLDKMADVVNNGIYFKYSASTGILTGVDSKGEVYVLGQEPSKPGRLSLRSTNLEATKWKISSKRHLMVWEDWMEGNSTLSSSKILHCGQNAACLEEGKFLARNDSDARWGWGSVPGDWDSNRCNVLLYYKKRLDALE